MKLVTVSQMQTIEKEADENGLTFDQMMENAGQPDQCGMWLGMDN